MMFILLLFVYTFATNYTVDSLNSGDHVIIVACGNAWGPCSSENPSKQMERVIAGLAIKVVGITWGGVKWEQAFTEGMAALQSVSRAIGPTGKIIFAGQSAGSWLSSIVAIKSHSSQMAGFISFYGPLDLPTLWQKNEWGKINSPRGPILYVMPWGIPGCDNCNDPFPRGDSWFWNISNPNDPRNEKHMIDANEASPYKFFNDASPAMYVTQGLEDGIIGQYRGVSQARRMYNKLNGRSQDVLIECPNYAHGYEFTSPCTSSSLRRFICTSFSLC